MAYPPPTLAINRTDATPQQTTHPADHNAVNGAVNDIVAELGANPSGAVATVQARLDGLAADAAIKGCKWLISSQLVNGALTFAPSSVVFDTGGYQESPTTAYMRIPTGEPHAISFYVRGDGVAAFTSGALVSLNTGQSGYIAYDQVPAGQGLIQCCTVLTLNPNDYVQFNINTFGVAMYCSGYAQATRVSRGF